MQSAPGNSTNKQEYLAEGESLLLRATALHAGFKEKHAQLSAGRAAPVMTILAVGDPADKRILPWALVNFRDAAKYPARVRHARHAVEMTRTGSYSLKRMAPVLYDWELDVVREFEIAARPLRQQWLLLMEWRAKIAEIHLAERAAYRASQNYRENLRMNSLV